MQTLSKLLVLLAIVAISGCATPKTLFCQSPEYELAVYMYLKEDPNLDEQIDLMNAYFEEAESNNQRVAPGAYAHMAMLYAAKGEDISVKKYLDLEKSAFPESAYYIDYLANLGKSRSAKNEGSSNEATSNTTYKNTQSSQEK